MIFFRNIIYLSLLVFVALLTTSCGPDSYKTKDYMSGTGYKDPIKWYQEFSDIKVPTTYEYEGYIDHKNRRMVDSPSPTDFIFKGPVAVLFNRRGPKDIFLRIPNLNTANSLSEAKTLFYVEYTERAEIGYLFQIRVYDIETRYYIAGYDASDSKTKPPGETTIIRHVSELLGYPQYVNDGNDNLAIYGWYVEHIKRLGYEKMISKFQNTHLSARTNTPDTAKLAGFTRNDVKAMIGNHNWLLLTDQAKSMPEKKDWLIIADIYTGSDYESSWYEIEVKSGRRTGRSGENTIEHYDIYYINGNDGSVITSYSGGKYSDPTSILSR